MKLSGRSTSLGGFGLQRQRQLCVGSGRTVAARAARFLSTSGTFIE